MKFFTAVNDLCLGTADDVMPCYNSLQFAKYFLRFELNGIVARIVQMNQGLQIKIEFFG